LIDPSATDDKRRDTQKTQHGIETGRRAAEERGDYRVETLRKPSTGLKPVFGPHHLFVGRRDTQKTQHGIETAPPRGTSSRPTRRDTQKTQHGIETEHADSGQRCRHVETLRKPSTGLKQPSITDAPVPMVSRDTQKTQHGIETASSSTSSWTTSSRDTQKTQHGIETTRRCGTIWLKSRRDTQKTQHGIETQLREVVGVTSEFVETLRKPSTGLKRDRVEPLRRPLRSRHSENPARD